ncbi:MAG: beta-phosphoglucomutase [Candidatus Limiplasma sp.]|nr:beta-phosphoglucomutase [Candidatus Limiplasma sp.]
MALDTILGVIFDLDGVLVSTDHCHYLGWKRMADEEGIPFDRAINERLRGVSRMESLSIVLEKAEKAYSQQEKEAMAARKNAYYVELIGKLGREDILPGTAETLKFLGERGVKMAIGSSSKNTPLILRQIGLEGAFDAVADGNQISRSKPDPEVFLLAARLLRLPPAQCLVVEDADAGIEAAAAAGMRSLGVGFAAANPTATYRAQSLAQVDWNEILG